MLELTPLFSSRLCVTSLGQCFQNFKISEEPELVLHLYIPTFHLCCWWSIFGALAKSHLPGCDIDNPCDICCSLLPDYWKYLASLAEKSKTAKMKQARKLFWGFLGIVTAHLTSEYTIITPNLCRPSLILYVRLFHVWCGTILNMQITDTIWKPSQNVPRRLKLPSSSVHLPREDKSDKQTEFKTSGHMTKPQLFINHGNPIAKTKTKVRSPLVETEPETSNPETEEIDSNSRTFKIAYIYISIHPSARKYLRICMGEKVLLLPPNVILNGFYYVTFIFFENLLFVTSKTCFICCLALLTCQSAKLIT